MLYDCIHLCTAVIIGCIKVGQQENNLNVDMGLSHLKNKCCVKYDENALIKFMININPYHVLHP